MKRSLDKNKIINCDNYYEIILCNKRKQEVARAKIDKENLSKIKNFKWGISSHGYAKTDIKRKRIYLHQLIIGKKQGFITDHANRNKLDDRKQNLRFATRSQNMMNRRNKGTVWDKDRQKWRAQIGFNKKCIYLGIFTNKKKAILTKRKAEKKYFGKFALK